MTFSKPAACASAVAATTPAAGPESAVRTGKARALAVDITPPFDCTICKPPAKLCSPSWPGLARPSTSWLLEERRGCAGQARA